MNYYQEYNKIVSFIIKEKLYGVSQLGSLSKNLNFNSELVCTICNIVQEDGFDLDGSIWHILDEPEEEISTVLIEKSYEKYKKYLGFPKTIDSLYEKGIDVNQIYAENPYIVTKYQDDDDYMELDFNRLSSNLELHQSFIEKNIMQRWNFRAISENQNISIEFIKNNLTRGWDWYMLSMIRRTIKNDYLKYPELHWNKRTLYQNPHIDIDFIKRFPPSDTKDISANSGITMEMVSNHPEIKWDYSYLSKNPNLTIDFVLKNLDKPLDWYDISSNPGITMEDIKNHPDLPWIREASLHNPNLTFDYLEPFIRQLSYNEIDIILMNKFGKHPFLQKRTQEKEEKERIIQRTRIFEEELMARTWDPKIERNIPRIMEEIIEN